MADSYDFFQVYVMGIVQLLTGFHFFLRFLRKRAGMVQYVLFAVLGIVTVIRIPGNNITENLIYIVLLALWGIFVCGKDAASVVLDAFATIIIMQLSYGILNSVISILYPLALPLERRTVGIIFMAAGSSMAILLSIICYRIADRHFAAWKKIIPRYVPMCLTPLALVFLTDGYIHSVFYGNTVVTKAGGLMENAQMLFVQILGMASLFCMMAAGKKFTENFHFNMELAGQKQEEYVLRKYVQEAKARYEKTTSFRHDIKNHIMIVKELLQNEKPERALNYINAMENAAAELSFPCNTNHPVADILIGNKLERAQNRGTLVSCSLVLPYPCTVSDMDFCILLSNALDNAVHACESMEADTQKYIRVAGGMQGDFLLLEVENSFQGSRIWKRGTGLSNISSIAEKYHGTVESEVQNGVFILRVLLLIPQQPECISQQSGKDAGFDIRKRE